MCVVVTSGRQGGEEETGEARRRTHVEELSRRGQRRARVYARKGAHTCMSTSRTSLPGATGGLRPRTPHASNTKLSTSTCKGGGMRGREHLQQNEMEILNAVVLCSWKKGRAFCSRSNVLPRAASFGGIVSAIATRPCGYRRASRNPSPPRKGRRPSRCSLFLCWPVVPRRYNRHTFGHVCAFLFLTRARKALRTSFRDLKNNTSNG